MIYLNNAATSYPKPATVLKDVQNCLEGIPSLHNRGGYNDSPVSLEVCRQQVSDFFSADDPSQIVFTSGATHSLNTLISGMLNPGAKVITSSTEHNSVLRPLYRLEKMGLITLHIIPCDAEGCIDRQSLKNQISTGCDMVIINQISNVTGALQDITGMASLAHRYKALFIADASQAAGHIPVDVTESGVDALVFTGHKGLMGIQGSGGFYLKKGIHCRPLMTGGTGVKSDLREQPREMPRRLEAGTPGFPGILSMHTGIQWLSSVGLQSIMSHENSLRAAAIEGLSKIDNVNIQAAGTDHSGAGLFSFTIRGMSSGEVSYILEKSFGIITRPGLHCAPLIHKKLGTYPEGSVRISFSAFSTSDDSEQLVHAVQYITRVV